MSTYAVFFFYGYVHHRDLHSFPTRRSSDLDDRDLMPVALRLQPPVALPPIGVHAGTRLDAGWEDRKSTRLNSSHTVISYAVFCLKKKKESQSRNINGTT